MIERKKRRRRNMLVFIVGIEYIVGRFCGV